MVLRSTRLVCRAAQLDIRVLSGASPGGGRAGGAPNHVADADAEHVSPVAPAASPAGVAAACLDCAC
eukprot:1881447-Prymnesium_polylepis.1